MPLCHGVNRKTAIAGLATVFSLAVSTFLAYVFADLAKLSGLSEEAFYLKSAISNVPLNLQGLLLGGIIVGTLGALDDVTVSQASVTFALRESDPNVGVWRLYGRAMVVGRDHIASLINTLVLIYAGASLPLVLLFSATDLPFGAVLNREVVATEVVRSLVGTIGLITSVPLTTIIAAVVSNRTPTDY